MISTGGQDRVLGHTGTLAREGLRPPLPPDTHVGSRTHTQSSPCFDVLRRILSRLPREGYPPSDLPKDLRRRTSGHVLLRPETIGWTINHPFQRKVRCPTGTVLRVSERPHDVVSRPHTRRSPWTPTRPDSIGHTTRPRKSELGQPMCRSRDP